MASLTSLLAALSLVVCLSFANGRTWKRDVNSYHGYHPETVDEALVKLAVQRNARHHGRTGSDKISDGLDMMLTKEQHARLFQGALGRSDEPLAKTWTNNVLPYELIPGHFQDPHKSKIRDAIALWQNLTCITFRPATRSDRNKVQLHSGQGCWSELGMAKEARSQLLSLETAGCFWRGTVEHEFGHAIGLVHEHQRPNRDNHIGVYESNIDPRFRDQLKKYAPDAVDKLGLNYDYYSVMHYGQHAFAYNPSLQTLFAYNRRSGQRLPEITKKLGKVLGPSFTDVKLVNLMYKCSANCNPMPACRADCFVDKNCQCFCEENMAQPPCSDHQNDCAQRVASGECVTYRHHMEIYCRKSCHMCAVENGLPPEEVPSDVTPCVNNDSQCDSWARAGECSNNPSYMHAYCRKACRLCTDGSTGAITNCVDENTDCEYWANTNECSRNPGYMLKHCQKSCGVC